MLHMLLSSISYVPYNSDLWQYWWGSIMTTIGAASTVGMIVFIAVTVIGVFKIVIRWWLG